MNSKQKIEWFNERDPFHEWAVDDDVFCLHCDGVFKAQDVAQLADDWPTCPVCRTSSPLDFSGMPWWREDLVDEIKEGEDIARRWIRQPIYAIAGAPGTLPPRAESEVKNENN